MKTIAVLACAAALLVPAAASPDTAPYTIVGGTWVSGWEGRAIGPAWWLDGTTANYGVTMVGPGGFTRHMGGPNQRFPGMPSTRSVYWCSNCGESAPGGSWYAIGDGDHTNVPFTIDQTSRLQPVVVGQYSGDASTFTASWSADPNAKSFVAYIQDEGDTSATDWIVGQELPAGSSSVTFTNMNLNPNYAYEFDVFAFSGDIVNGPAPSVFNIASTRVDFVPSVLAQYGPQNGGPCFYCGPHVPPPPCPSWSAGCTMLVPTPPSSYRLCWHERGWSVSSSAAAPCASAKSVFHSYAADDKCVTGGTSFHECTVQGYRCAYRSSNGTLERVDCSSRREKGLIRFQTG